MSMGYRIFVGGLLSLALAIGPADARDLAGRVIGIQDGDTVTVLDASNQQHRIRLAGIDAPEKAQAFGTAAKEHLARLAFGKQADLRCAKRDRYGREVCSLYVGARDVGLEQVRSGHAWWYREYAREQSLEDRTVYEIAESDARDARRGLWRDASPQAPWAWRRQTRGTDPSAVRAGSRT